MDNIAYVRKKIRGVVLYIFNLRLIMLVWKTKEFIAKAQIKQFLRKRTVINLELGECYKRLNGWITIDKGGYPDIRLDFRKPIPFPDNSVDQIYCSHFLEHFSYPELMSLLAEVKRILKPGGIFKIAVPDARIFLEAYFNPENFPAKGLSIYQPAFNYYTPIDYVNYLAYMAGEHHYLFDERQLVAVLSGAGFTNVKLREFEKELDLGERREESIYAVAGK